MTISLGAIVELPRPVITTAAGRLTGVIASWDLSTWDLFRPCVSPG
jgi:hypothetical protein